MEGDTVGVLKSNRSLRRAERKQRIQELLLDMETVETAIRYNRSEESRLYLGELLERLYDAYCEVVSSEV